MMQLPSFLIVFFLLLVRSHSLQNRCPSRRMLEPCTCTEEDSKSKVKCEDVQSFDDLQSVIDRSLDYAFDALELVGCTIPHLNSTWIFVKKVLTLSVRDATMIDLMDDHVSVPQPRLDYVNIERTKLLRGLRWIEFKPFANLTRLTVNGSQVRGFGEDFKNGVSSRLRWLTVTDTRLKVLKDVDFTGKPELEIIWLGDNRIKVLKKSFFNDQRSKIAMVDFSGNPIESLPDDLFDGMLNLGIISLARTKLKTLSRFLNFVGALDVNNTLIVCDCKLKWVPKKGYSLLLVGSCDSPPELKGKRFEDLRDADFGACD